MYYKKKTAYEMHMRDWSSDVCSSDHLAAEHQALGALLAGLRNLHLEVMRVARRRLDAAAGGLEGGDSSALRRDGTRDRPRARQGPGGDDHPPQDDEETGRAACRGSGIQER